MYLNVKVETITLKKYVGKICPHDLGLGKEFSDTIPTAWYIKEKS